MQPEFPRRDISSPEQHRGGRRPDLGHVVRDPGHLFAEPERGDRVEAEVVLDDPPSIPSPFGVPPPDDERPISPPNPFAALARNIMRRSSPRRSTPSVEPVQDEHRLMPSSEWRRLNRERLDAESERLRAVHADGAAALSRNPWPAQHRRLGSADVVPRNERAYTLVTRWPEGSPYTQQEHDRYGTANADMIDATARLIRSGEIDTYAKLWNAASAARARTLTPREITTMRGPFTQPRPDLLTTDMDQPHYRSIRSRLTAQLDAYLAESGARGTTRAERLADLDRRLDPQEQRYVHGLAAVRPSRDPGRALTPDLHVSFGRDAVNPRMFTVTLEVFSPVAVDPHDATLMHIYNVHVDDDRVEPKELVNTKMTDDDVIAHMRHIHDEYGKALAADDVDTMLDHAFRAYRTNVSIAPDERGSASKSHFVLQSVLLARGYALPPSVAGRAADLEAMASSREAWPQIAREVFGIV